MALPAALIPVANFVAQRGTTQAIKKFGKKAVNAVTQQSKTGKFKGRRTPEADLKQPIKKDSMGRTYSVMGRPQLLARSGRDVGLGILSNLVTVPLAAGLSIQSIRKKEKEKKPRTPFEMAFSEAHNAGQETFLFDKGDGDGQQLNTTDVKKSIKTPAIENQILNLAMQTEPQTVAQILANNSTQPMRRNRR